jgi:hypothetical protein
MNGIDGASAFFRENDHDVQRSIEATKIRFRALKY